MHSFELLGSISTWKVLFLTETAFDCVSHTLSVVQADQRDPTMLRDTFDESSFDQLRSGKLLITHGVKHLCSKDLSRESKERFS